MLSEERRMKIFEYLKSKTSATTDELIEKFNASGSTIRRDLEYLANKQFIRRTHSGAIVNTPYTEGSFIVNYNFMKEEKQIIARKTLKLIEDNDFIALSGGTTSYMLAYELINSSLRDLTILTNSVNISTLIIESTKNFRLILTGGMPRKGTYECIGEIALRTIRNFNIDKFFVGVNGISIKGGITFSNMEEAEIAKEVHSHSRKTYVIADHTKFGIIKSARTLEINEIDGIITDFISENLDKTFKGLNKKIELI
ncbi:MAG: DeoR/GlpR family DNA-binding transcription regulator [Thermotogae bacterium]|jgi:DeoR/GlpR family transcriptional regulator of sugar metabolism|nr:DeoR/GlpR family DNA-binding transcription regulator [Thermotogota bacterium]